MIVAAAEEIQTALRDHWDDVTTALHDADARRLYVDVAAPLAERAVLQIHGVATDSFGGGAGRRGRRRSLLPRPVADLRRPEHG